MCQLVIALQPLVPPLGQAGGCANWCGWSPVSAWQYIPFGAGNALLESGLHHPQVDMNGI